MSEFYQNVVTGETRQLFLGYLDRLTRDPERINSAMHFPHELKKAIKQWQAIDRENCEAIDKWMLTYLSVEARNRCLKGIRSSKTKRKKSNITIEPLAKEQIREHARIEGMKEQDALSQAAAILEAINKNRGSESIFDYLTSKGIRIDSHLRSLIDVQTISDFAPPTLERYPQPPLKAPWKAPWNNLPDLELLRDACDSGHIHKIPLLRQKKALYRFMHRAICANRWGFDDVYVPNHAPKSIRWVQWREDHDSIYVTFPENHFAQMELWNKCNAQTMESYSPYFPTLRTPKYYAHNVGDILRRYFGECGREIAPVIRVTLRAKLSDFADGRIPNETELSKAYNNVIYLGGRIVAMRDGENTSPCNLHFHNGVRHVTNSFLPKAGSKNNIRIGKNEVVILIHSVPLDLAMKEVTDDRSISIVINNDDDAIHKPDQKPIFILDYLKSIQPVNF